MERFPYILFGIFGGMSIGGQIGGLVHAMSGSFAAGLVVLALFMAGGGYIASRIFR